MSDTPTISSTEFRERLSEIVDLVDSGTDFIFVLGRGKRAKKIKLVSTKSSGRFLKQPLPVSNTLSIRLTRKHKNIDTFINSKHYKDFRPNSELINADNLKNSLTVDYLKDKYDI
jgi:hypothetical protein